MFDAIIAYSVRNKFVVGLCTLALVLWGLYSLSQIPIDAVPDITNNQVMVITASPTLATQEVEQFITTPVELALQTLQELVEIRSISRFGLSVVTVVFEESTDVYLARQWVGERLLEASESIPPGLGTPYMAPVSTGLGEIYQYVVRALPGYEQRYSPTELRSIQDWIVARQLSGIEGVVEVNSQGGFVKQYEVAVDPARLKAMQVSLGDIVSALENSNQNTGGAYIEKNPRTYYIRTNGIVNSLDDLAKIVVEVRDGRPVLIRDVGTVQFGKAPRYGALVHNGHEAVGGKIMMLKGANASAVTARVHERVEQVQKSLPEGVVIEPYLVRDKLVSTAIGTVRNNLLEGGLIVVFVLVLLLGNLRASLIVASVIPLAMLFAISMMNLLGISANLMSLGAIDFGLVVDGAVIIVEAIIHRLRHRMPGLSISQERMDDEVTAAAIGIRSSAAFGEIIILIVYVPILALVGIEGLMFRPMAQTVMLAILGALILSLTYVPMMSALALSKTIVDRRNFSDRIIGFCQNLYRPVLAKALRWPRTIVAATLLLFALSIWVFSRMGGEFIPTLEEGDLAMQQILPTGASLSQSVEMAERIQQKILAEVPEVLEIVTAIGSAEIPTDPMPVEVGDYTLIMKPKDEWTSASDRQGMFERLEEVVSDFPGVALEFSQPIQLRFNELMTGTKADIAIKLYGQDLELAHAKAREAEQLIASLPGVGSVNVEQTTGMPQVVVDFKYNKLAQYGLQVQDVNRVIQAAFAGADAGTIYEGDRRFALTVRLLEASRKEVTDVRDLFIPLAGGQQVPLRELADVELIEAPAQISRDDTHRRIVIGVNVGDRDVESLVKEIQTLLDDRLELPAGYYLSYGGQFENLKAASARLMVAVPLALALIFILLFFTFGSIRQALLIFVAIPLSAIGGIWALELRDMPFSISAGIGFIALFGVAVLNGIVLIGYFNQLAAEGISNVEERIMRGTELRLRPVIMTAAVASLGFLPMALSNSGGAEVQRPLATVVIGGLISATLLTLLVLPILYRAFGQRREDKASSMGGPGGASASGTLIILLMIAAGSLAAQPAMAQPVARIELEEAVALALQQHPGARLGQSKIAQAQSLQNLPYQPGKTTIFYRGDALYRPNSQRINQLTALQYLPSPAAIRASNAVQDAYAGRARAEAFGSVANIKAQVQSLYYQLQHSMSLARLYAQLDQQLRAFVAIARQRAELGEASSLDLLQLQTALQQNQQYADQNEVAVQSLSQRLNALIGSESILWPQDSMLLRTVPLAMDTLGTANPSILLAQQQIAIDSSQTALIAAELKPEYQVGYGSQYYDDGGWLWGMELGVSVPLFRSHIRRRVRAQQLQVEVDRAELDLARLELSQERLQLLQEIEQARVASSFYAEQIRDVQPEIIRVSKLQYQAGQIGYLDLLASQRLILQNGVSFFDQILLHNLAVVRLEYLLQP